MSDWSYRYNQPRSVVHQERYGNTNVPTRRGMGGASLSTSTSPVWWVAAMLVGGVLIYVLSRK